MKIEDEKAYNQFLDESKKHFIRKLAAKGEKTYVKLSEFDVLYKLGAGAFGKVVLVKNKKTGDYYAMKILKKAHLIKSKQIDHTLNEKNILMICRHPNLMTMEFFAQDNGNLYFILPFLNAGDLYSSLSRARRFTETVSKFFAGQVLLGLEYLQYLDIIYRDLKPENIMVEATGYVKLTDFGFCKVIKGRTYTICGTPEYIAPELVTMKGYGFSADWWSFGILLFEMTAGYVPFKDNGDHVRLYSAIVSGKYRMHSSFSRELKDLVFNLLQVDVTKRIGCLKRGIKEIKEHMWFNDLPWIHLINRKIVPPMKPHIENPSEILQNNEEDIEKLSAVSDTDHYPTEFLDF